MNPLITNAEKKTFVEWFLQNHELKKREGAWLLSYFISDDELLAKVRFVDDLPKSKRSILMSAKCIKGIPFQFKKGRIVSTDVEKAFHDIRLHPDEDIFLKLLFDQYELCPKYAAVREVSSPETGQVSTNTLYSLLAEMVLDEAVEKFAKERLLREIDQSLAEYDREKFLRLSKHLQKYTEEG